MPSSSELELFRKSAPHAVSAEELLSAALHGIKAAIAACDSLGQLDELERRLDRIHQPESRTRQALALKRKCISEPPKRECRKGS